MSTFIELCREEMELLKERIGHLEGYLAACDESDEPAPRKNQFAHKPEADNPWRGKTVRAVRHCKKCGQPGHRSDACPQNKGASELEKVKSGDDGRLAGDDDTEKEDEPKEVTREQVQALKDEGLTSLSIAARLGVRLSEVNKHW